MWPGITRLSLVCLRFDDYHQDVDHAAWREVLTAYVERGLVGVVAVPPKFEGEPLSTDAADFLKELERSGWEIAQHGYTHENVGEGRGGILYDERSEVGGLPRTEQERRIAAGRNLLREHGFEPTTFVPPWHEYDRATIRVLSDLGFTCLNEGRWPIPRTIDGVTLIPTHVPGVTPAMLAIGVVTLVGHPHLESEPMSNADLVSGFEDRLRTPSEVTAWWQDRRFTRSPPMVEANR